MKRLTLRYSTDVVTISGTGDPLVGLIISDRAQVKGNRITFKILNRLHKREQVAKSLIPDIDQDKLCIKDVLVSVWSNNTIQPKNKDANL